MATLQKIDKEFLLSDDSVNCYGFRMLTEGYNLADFKRNPIGYYMHRRDDGVLIRWDDLTVKNGAVYGKPVINMNNPRGQQTVDEVENGFLNAASVGHLIIIESTDDPSLKLAGQTGPTVLKWTNKEASLVDVPGNYNALKLYDIDENEINLADFAKQAIYDTHALATKQNKDLTALSGDELYHQGKWEALKAVDLELYKSKFKEYFGVECEGLASAQVKPSAPSDKDCNNAEISCALGALSGEQLYYQGKWEALKAVDLEAYKTKFKAYFGVEPYLL